MRFGLLGRRDHLRLAGGVIPIADIIAHRAVHQAALLLDHADMAAQTVLLHQVYALPININLAGFSVIKPEQKLEQS